MGGSLWEEEWGFSNNPRDAATRNGRGSPSAESEVSLPCAFVVNDVKFKEHQLATHPRAFRLIIFPLCSVHQSPLYTFYSLFIWRCAPLLEHKGISMLLLYTLFERERNFTEKLSLFFPLLLLYKRIWEIWKVPRRLYYTLSFDSSRVCVCVGLFLTTTRR